MKLILCLFLVSFTAALQAQNVGQYEIRKRGASGFTPYGVTLADGQVIGQTAGVPAAITPITSLTWGSITGTPTTLAGYGITDAITATLAASTYQPLIGTGTLDLSKLATDPLARANHTGTQAWSTITGTPTTRSGYGITDAQAQSANLDALSAGFGPTLGAHFVTWDGTNYAMMTGALSTGFGGTGISTYAIGDLLYYGASSMQRLAGNTTTTKKFLSQTGSGSAALDPAWSTITAGDITGTLPVANGGTGQTTLQASINALMTASGALSQGDVFYFNGTNVVRLAAGTSGQYLQTQGAGANPRWFSVAAGLTIGTTTITSGTAGYMLYNNAGTLGQLATTGSGSVVRATSPTLSDASISGKTYFGDPFNYAWRNGAGDTELHSASNEFSVLSIGGNSIFRASLSGGITIPALVITQSSWPNYPAGYPTLPTYENYHGGRSYRPGVNVTSFASHVFSPGDIYDGTGITVNDAATVYVEGEPFQHPSGATISGNKWALWIAHGPSRFDGPVTAGPNGTAHGNVKSGVATLVGGTVTVSDANVIETGAAATSSRIFVTRMTDGGTVGHYSITRINSTSFTITSSSASDTSTVSWLMLNP